jgi:uncharacterized membrane protein YeiB
MYSRCESTYLGIIKHYSYGHKGSFRVCQEACCETWSVKMGFASLWLREISLGPSCDWIQKCMVVLHKVKG